jgi:predicted aspartyl protease
MQDLKGLPMSRFSVEFDVSNYRDVIAAEMGILEPEKVRRARIKGVVDSGASYLVLPAKVVKQLGLPKADKVRVRYADRRQGIRDLVDDAHVEMVGRHATFQAIAEPKREDALIGAIVLETFDLLPDCRRERLVPRDPDYMTGEIE